MNTKIISISSLAIILLTSCWNTQKVEDIDYNKKIDININTDKNKFNNANIDTSDEFVATEDMTTSSWDTATNTSFSWWKNTSWTGINN